MKNKTMRRFAAVMALALLLSLSACGGGGAEPSQAPSEAPPSQTPEPQDTPEPTGTPTPTAAPDPTATPAPEPTATPTPEPTPSPAPEPTPQPTQFGLEDASYMANVTLSGGTGRASVQSPAALRCTSGQFTATIVWSSPNFDYMKVNGVRYDPISAPGSNSAFEIPVAAFDTPLPVIADTVAMSEPHEVEYTLTFDSTSLTKQ